MLYLALFSGLVNLASQSIFMRVVSAANGDYYLTYYLTTLSFIVISALGNLVSFRIRRFLPYVEIASGLYALGIAIAVRAGVLAGLALPTWAAVAVLVPPALALGVHVPLYTHFVRKHVGLTYGLYHLGAAAGVIALEWFVLPNVALSSTLIALGVAQVVLGLAVKGSLSAEQVKPAAIAVESFLTWAVVNRKAVGSVFVASFASYLALAWGLRSYQFLVLPARMHNGLYNGAVLMMLAAGGLLALPMRRRAMGSLLPMVGAWLAVSVLFYRAGPNLLYLGSVARVEAYSLALALLMNLPVLVSAVVFSRAAEGLGGSRDVSAGRLMVIAALGNLFGGMSALLCGNSLLTITPALTVVALLALVLLSQGFEGRRASQAGWLAAGGVAVAIAVAVGFQPIRTVFGMRMPKLPVVSTTLTTKLGSTAGYVTVNVPVPGLPKNITPPQQKAYFVDGHNSHFVTMPGEISVGLMPSKVISAPFERSVVIGLGSGESAYGVSAISKHTDIVEISPAVLAALPTLAWAHHDVLARPDVTLHRDDGLNYVRHCEPHSVDFIFNTSTYAMMFNAYKLYSDEFVRAASTCMKPDGIIELYVDWNIASQVNEVRTFLAPVAHYFKHIYFSPYPYPTILASNRELSVGEHDDLTRTVSRQADRDIIARSAPILETLSCSGWAPAGPFMPTGKEALSTLDQPVIETTSVKLRLYELTHPKPRKSDLYFLLKPFNPGVSEDQCKSHAGWMRPPAWVTGPHPLDVPLLTGTAGEATAEQGTPLSDEQAVAEGK
ncbi:hypothetical protein AB4Y45_34025 [Paraburkholderia sp. EG287A]|uniref:spermine/spermidine synthase domain-containing protein n=1 Tax=Paraburkholderia sp. EG287A TaxID=3237012 RepID=UPI0034D1A2F9